MIVNKLIGLKRKAKKAGWKKDFSPGDEDALLQGCTFHSGAGHDPIDFIETFCVQTQGRWAGKPLELLNWQKEDLLIPLYGWKREDGTRRYRQALVEVAKKNGKSTLCSGLQIYGLMGDGEPGAEIYSAATSRQQASIVFNEAANMVEASPLLSKRLKVVRHRSTIHFGNNAWIRALSSDAPSSEGLKIYYLIIDELHVWTDPTFLNSLRWGAAARKQPLRIDITTVGDDPDSLWGQRHDYALKVLSGELFNYEFLPVIFCPEDNADIDDPKTHMAGNPSMGEIINYTDFTNQLKEAKETGPSDLAAFMRYRLNIAGISDNPYFPAERFKQQSQVLSLSLEDLRELRCWGGVDLSAVEDTTALVWVFELPNGGWFILPCFWVPETKIQEELKQGRSNYQKWAAKGWINVIPGPIIDQEYVYEQIRRDAGIFRVQRLGFDRWRADQLMKAVGSAGVDVVEWGQSLKDFTEPTKQFKAQMLIDQLFHNGNECFTHQLANVVCDEDNAGNVKPVKRKNKKRFKIDGPVAAIMGFGLAVRNDGPEPSRWDTEENPILYTVG